MTVITRFAPSPTGYLHIGGARTALFNWLFAKHTQGKFYLRIEDTDKQRSTPEATQAILDGLKWLGLNWDGEPYFQQRHEKRHAEVAQQLIERGQAYHCYATAEELAALREQKLPYDRRWRDAGGKNAPSGVKPSVRLKAPLDEDVVVQDHIRGEVRVPAGQIEDLVILRSDETPTYNLAVVVDDHDMGITHVIRGEDHLTNAAKQSIMYKAMGWNVPEFAHIPLIHGPDGAKLSKRHGAVGIEAYRDMGYLPEAMRNYLLRLGWAHGDDEIISDKQAVEWFDLGAVGKSPSRFDFAKLDSVNAHYIREADDKKLLQDIIPFMKKEYPAVPIIPGTEAVLLRGMPGLKTRAKTLKELAANALPYAVNVVTRKLYTHPTSNPKAHEVLEKGGREIIANLLPLLELQQDWSRAALEQFCRSYADSIGHKIGNVAQPLRAGIWGSMSSPPIFEVMEILGKQETIGRLKDVC